jgi:hypothetical protein
MMSNLKGRFETRILMILQKVWIFVFRHSDEPRIRSGAGAGVQYFQTITKILDSGFHQTTFYEIINIEILKKNSKSTILKQR